MEPKARLAASQLVRLLGSWHRPGPSYLALAHGLRRLVLDGRLPLRARLPSERELATTLGVSRTTTTAAYNLLRDEGFVDSRRGSGSRIALPTGGVHDRELLGVVRDMPATEAIDLTIAALPAPGAMMEAVELATRDFAGHLGGSGYDPRGLPSLRDTVAERLLARGIPTDHDQIVITSGAQHALALLLQVLVAPGDAVLVEEPTYPNAFGALRHAGALIVPIAMLGDGWDIDAIRACFRRDEPRLAFMVPDFQNPTGHLMPDDQRRAVVAAAARAGAHVIVDETFASLDLDPKRSAPAAMAAHDPGGHVVTVGSMSKAYWGGLRVGWIRCSAPLARRLAQARAAIDLATPVFEQLIAIHLLRASDTVIAERRDLLTTRREVLVASLRQMLPRWRFTVPRGGLCLWIDLGRAEAETLAEAAEAEGVRIIPGTTFSVEGGLQDRIRLPFTQPAEALKEAVRRLAVAERHLRVKVPA